MDADPAVVDGAEDGPREKTANRLKLERTASAEAERIRAVVERGRPPGYATVTTRHIEPRAPAAPEDIADCAACGLPFLMGEGHWRDPERDNRLAHTNGGCDRARARAAAREAASPAPVPASPAFTVTPPPVARPARSADPQGAAKRNEQAVLGALASNGETQQAALAAMAHVPKGSIVSVVTRLAERGAIVRRGVCDADGTPTVRWRLAGEAEPTEPEPAPVVLTAEEAAADVRRQDGRAASVEPPARPAVEPAPAPDADEDATAVEYLTARYVNALIATIERASVLRGEVPAHVFDRIERILGIEADGA